MNIMYSLISYKEFMTPFSLAVLMSKDRPLIAVIDDEEPVRNVNSLDPKNREQVISTVRQLLKGNNPGILSTVDQSAFHSRAGWLPCRSMTSQTCTH